MEQRPARAQITGSTSRWKQVRAEAGLPSQQGKRKQKNGEKPTKKEVTGVIKKICRIKTEIQKERQERNLAGPRRVSSCL
jgi:hypothetical protein